MRTTLPRSGDPRAASAPAAAASTIRILVWDVPTRVFHWLMVLCFAGAYLTAESDSLRAVHVTLGYTMAGLVAFRLAWGFVGSRYARFAAFVRGPRAAARYVASLVSGRPERHVGHNPAGALAIVALLTTAVLLVASGWATWQEIGGKGVEEVHEAIANIMLALVLVHVGGVLVSSWLHRENLVGAMLHGHKKGRPGEGIRHRGRTVATLLLALVLGFWWWQWQSPAPARDAQHAASVQHDSDDD